MAPKNILVTGANRGIGFGLVREFLKTPEVKRVFATARKPSEAKNLTDISDRRLIILEMEVNCDKSIQKVFSEVEKLVGDEGLNLLVNNAGIFVEYDPREKPKRPELQRQIEVNSISPIVITQFFLPLLKKAAEHFSTAELSTTRAAVVNISSTAGSIGLNDPSITPEFQWPALIAYRISKSAVNAATRELGNLLSKDGILVACFCPGWVKTDMGGDTAELTLEESMAQLVPTIYRLSNKENGGYFKQNGDVLPF